MASIYGIAAEPIQEIQAEVFSKEKSNYWLPITELAVTGGWIFCSVVGIRVLTVAYAAQSIGLAIFGVTASLMGVAGLFATGVALTRAKTGWEFVQNMIICQRTIFGDPGAALLIAGSGAYLTFNHLGVSTVLSVAGLALLWFGTTDFIEEASKVIGEIRQEIHNLRVQK
jgi:hypothetical protein